MHPFYLSRSPRFSQISRYGDGVIYDARNISPGWVASVPTRNLLA